MIANETNATSIFGIDFNEFKRIRTVCAVIYLNNALHTPNQKFVLIGISVHGKKGTRME